MGLICIDKKIQLAQYPDNEPRRRIAEANEWVSSARELRIHVGHGVDTVAAIPRAGCFTHGVDHLVADSASFLKPLLHQGPIVEFRPALVWAPLRNVFAVAQGVSQGFGRHDHENPKTDSSFCGGPDFVGLEE